MKKANFTQSNSTFLNYDEILKLHRVINIDKNTLNDTNLKLAINNIFGVIKIKPIKLIFLNELMERYEIEIDNEFLNGYWIAKNNLDIEFKRNNINSLSIQVRTNKYNKISINGKEIDFKIFVSVKLLDYDFIRINLKNDKVNNVELENHEIIKYFHTIDTVYIDNLLVNISLDKSIDLKRDEEIVFENERSEKITINNLKLNFSVYV